MMNKLNYINLSQIENHPGRGNAIAYPIMYISKSLMDVFSPPIQKPPSRMVIV